jgi:hypothetical protein
LRGKAGAALGWAQWDGRQWAGWALISVPPLSLLGTLFLPPWNPPSPSRRDLLKPGGLVAPDRAELFVAGVDDRDFLLEAKEQWAQVCACVCVCVFVSIAF